MLLKRRLAVLVAAVTMVASMLALSAPAFATKGGFPNRSSCGVGKEFAHLAIADQTRPGAGELSLLENRPGVAGCTGPG